MLNNYCYAGGNVASGTIYAINANCVTNHLHQLLTPSITDLNLVQSSLTTFISIKCSILDVFAATHMSSTVISLRIWQ